MKKLLTLLFAIVLLACENGKRNPLEAVNNYVLIQMDSMYARMQSMEEAVKADKPVHYIQKDFADARRNYKRIESLCEYYFPNMSKFLNGPALDKNEEYDDKVVEATGFQVIEELIFPTYDTTKRKETLDEISIFLNGKKRFVQLVKDNQLSYQNVFQAVRLQLLRIASLGISGFDSPIAQYSVSEARAALEGIEQILLLTEPSETRHLEMPQLIKNFEQTYRFLDANQDFNTFDRAEFISNHLASVSKHIYQYQKHRNIQNKDISLAINMDETNFFSENLVNVGFFTPDLRERTSQGIIDLGKTLFFDPILSGNNSRSCASCHQPAKAFADNKSKSVAFNFKGELARNTPTLINSGFQRQQFWDQRVQFLEDQVNDVITNRDEMHGDIERSLPLIMKSKAYKELFKNAFPEKDAYDQRDLQIAIASYVRSLQGLNSNFDRFMRAEKSKLSKEAIAGFNLFMGKAKCGTCHFLPLFNGTVPPMYNDTEAEVLGVPATTDTINAQLDSDAGKYNTYKRALFRNAFKTPTVRNVSLTAPYMHNGVYRTLEEVIEFYNKGGGAGIGVELENQTLPRNKLNLTKEEQNQIIAFMHCLTDTTELTSKPKSLPSFQDAALDTRVIGGKY